MGGDSGIPFGNYTLLRRIVRGGIAEIFVARQDGIDGFDRLVAIKRILPHLLDDKNSTEIATSMELGAWLVGRCPPVDTLGWGEESGIGQDALLDSEEHAVPVQCSHGSGNSTRSAARTSLAAQL
ncbi:MAG: hypothetical protein GY811_13195 [Myxococcales bacterium]|nr:hypothetical protein [Myxococcales bacterium]